MVQKNDAEEEIRKVSGNYMETYLSEYYSVFYDLQGDVDLIIAITNKSVRAEQLVRKRTVFCCMVCGSILEEHSLFCDRT